MLSVLPFSGVETLKDGAFVKPAPAVSTLGEDRSRWEGVALEAFDCVPGCSVPEHCHPVHFVTLQTSGNVRTQWTSGGRVRSAYQSSGTICILPKGSLHRHQWSDTSSRIIVTLDSDFLARTTDQTAHHPDLELIEQWDLQDPHISALMIALHLDAKAGHPAGVLYGETIATALAVYLLRTQGVAQLNPQVPRGGLPRYRLRRICDFIDANIGRDLRLAELASVSGMSAHYFSQLFRKSTNESPHRYITRARIERAKQMLRLSGASIADIAIVTGFADQSHFTKVFRRLAGVTPSAYRAAS